MASNPQFQNNTLTLLQEIYKLLVVGGGGGGGGGITAVTGTVDIGNVPLPVLITGTPIDVTANLGTQLDDLSLEATQQQVLAQLTNIYNSLAGFEESIYTDDSDAIFIRRIILDQVTGVFSIEFYLPDGTPYVPTTGLRPVVAGDSLQVVSTKYIANTTTADYTIGDVINQLRFYDTSTSPVTLVETIYINENTGALIVPVLAHLDLITDTSAQEVTQLNVLAELGVILTVLNSIDAEGIITNTRLLDILNELIQANASLDTANTTLTSIDLELEKLKDIEELVFVDRGNANSLVIRNFNYSQTDGTIVITYTDLDGAVVVPVGPLALQEEITIDNIDYEIEETYFTANTEDLVAGYNEGDIIKEIITREYVGATETIIYKNLTQGTTIVPDPSHLSPLDLTTFNLLTQIDESINKLYEESGEVCTIDGADAVTVPASVYYSNAVVGFGAGDDTRRDITVTIDSDNSTYNIVEPLKISTGQALKVGFPTRASVGSIVETIDNPFALRVQFVPIGAIGTARVTFIKDVGLDSGTVSVLGGPTVAVANFLWSELYTIYVSGTNFIIEDPNGTIIISIPASANLQDTNIEHTVNFNLLSSLAGDPFSLFGNRNQYSLAYSRCDVVTPCSICRNNDLLEEIRDAISNQDFNFNRKTNDDVASTEDNIYLSGGVTNPDLLDITTGADKYSYLSVTNKGELFIKSPDLETSVTDLYNSEVCVEGFTGPNPVYSGIGSFTFGSAPNLSLQEPATLSGEQATRFLVDNIGSSSSTPFGSASFRLNNNTPAYSDPKAIMFTLTDFNIISAFDYVNIVGYFSAEAPDITSAFGLLTIALEARLDSSGVFANLIGGLNTIRLRMGQGGFDNPSVINVDASAFVGTLTSDLIFKLEIDTDTNNALVYINNTLVNTTPISAAVIADIEGTRTIYNNIGTAAGTSPGVTVDPTNYLDLTYSVEDVVCNLNTCTTCDIVNEVDSIGNDIVQAIVDNAIDTTTIETLLTDLQEELVDITSGDGLTCGLQFTSDPTEFQLTSTTGDWEATASTYNSSSSMLLSGTDEDTLSANLAFIGFPDIVDSPVIEILLAPQTVEGTTDNVTIQLNISSNVGTNISTELEFNTLGEIILLNINDYISTGTLPITTVFTLEDELVLVYDRTNETAGLKVNGVLAYSRNITTNPAVVGATTIGNVVFQGEFTSPASYEAQVQYTRCTEGRRCTTCDIVSQLEQVNTNLELSASTPASPDTEVVITKLVDTVSSAYDIIYMKEIYENELISTTEYYTIDTTGTATAYVPTGLENFVPFEKIRETEQLTRLAIETNTNVKSGILTDYSGIITTPDVSQLVVPASAVRSYVVIQNVSDTDMWVDFGIPATVDTSSILITPGGHLEMSLTAGAFMPTQDINIISTEAGKRFIAKQFTI